MSTMNRLANTDNEFQNIEQYKRVLCVCSAGLLRSPTTALILSDFPFSFNTRAAGLNTEYALIAVDEVLLKWADIIVCMSAEQKDQLAGMTKKTIINLDIPDQFEYRDPELVQIIRKKCEAQFIPETTKQLNLF
jgi:predicted protein tyrosine phosphatase